MTALASNIEEERSLADLMIRITHGVTGDNNIREQLLALFKIHFVQVVAIQVDQIGITDDKAGANSSRTDYKSVRFPLTTDYKSVLRIMPMSNPCCCRSCGRGNSCRCGQ